MTTTHTIRSFGALRAALLLLMPGRRWRWRAFASRHTIQVHLMGAAILVVLPILLFAHLAARSFTEAHENQVALQLEKQAHVIRENVARDLDHLRILASFIAELDPLVRRAPAQFHELVQAALRTDTDLHALVADTAGTQVLNSRVSYGEPLARLTATDALARVLGGEAPVISTVARASTTGRPLYLVMVPIVENGQITRVVSVNRAITHLGELLSANALPPNWFAAITDPTGRVLVSRGRDPRSTPAAGEPSNPPRVATVRDPLSHWSVLVAAPPQALWALSSRTWAVLTYLEALAVVASVAIAWWAGGHIAGPIRQLEAATKAFSQTGEWHTPRSEITEVRHVAKAFAQATTALVRGRQRLAALVETASDAIICIDRQGTVTLLNQAARELFCVGPDPRLAIADLLRPGRDPAAVNGGLPREYYRGRRCNGEEFCADVHVATSHIDDEYYTTLIVRDVTEQRRAAMNNAQLAVVVASSADAIYSMTHDYRILTWNPGAERLFGYRAEEIIGKSALLVVPDGAVAQFKEGAETIGRKATVRVETMRRTRNGLEIPVEIVAAPLCDAAGEIIGISSVVRDISERHRATVMRNHLAAIVASSVDAVVSIEANGRVLTWNAAAETLFGYSASEMIGRGIHRLLPPNERHLASASNQALLASGAYRAEGERVRKDGTLVPVAVTGMLINGAQGAPEGWALVYRDITEARKHEQHMSVVMRELSHRAKNLLAVIGSMARSTASSATSLAAFEEGFTARMAGLAQSHDLLVKKRWTGVSISQLVGAQMGAFFKYGDRQLKVAGDDLVVTPAAGQMLGIALHELATNAGKHGALKVATGLVHIRWHVEQGEERTFVLQWEESGGPPVVEPLSRGFGRDVLEYIVAENLDGSSVLSFAQTGVRWTLRAPLGSVAA